MDMHINDDGVRRRSDWHVCPVILTRGFTAHYKLWPSCTLCAPYWERMPVCPDHGKVLSYNFACPDCLEKFDATEKPSLDKLLTATGK